MPQVNPTRASGKRVPGPPFQPKMKIIRQTYRVERIRVLILSPVSISGSRAGGGNVTPSHFQQMHFMRHENEYFKQAPVIRISPNTVKVREDRAAFEAESRLKDQIIDIYKSHQTALGIEHQRTLQVADNAAQQMRSVFESSQKQYTDSELLRHQTQVLTNSQLTENHRDMFFGLGRQGCDLRSLYGNSPRRSGFSQQNT